ncbi:hypothetical protein CDD83_1192 [Cordyceps sp. RAO-2017]|nr:hypothetical protein CDD83_1192 [Cordyceps sp. RAO-2017]
MKHMSVEPEARNRVDMCQNMQQQHQTPSCSAGCASARQQPPPVTMRCSDSPPAQHEFSMASHMHVDDVLRHSPSKAEAQTSRRRRNGVVVSGVP